MAGLIGNLFKRVPQVLPQVVRAALPTVGKESSRHFSISSSLCYKPRVQLPAPHFQGTAVINGGFQHIKLEDYKGKYVVLFFYPLDFTFVCPTELIALDERIADFEKLNAVIIGCSVDSQYSHLGWMNTDRTKGGLGLLRYPLLSDINKEISRDYGVLLETEGVALRGMFIIDPKGTLRHITVNDLPIGRSVDETLRLIEALRFVEEHGEVCPANWKKGSKTIKPDPKASREYFESVNK